MSYTLDERFRQRLVNQLTVCLGKAQIYPEKDREMFLFAYLFPCQQLFENRNKENSYFERFIGPSPFLRFALDRLLRKFPAGSNSSVDPVALTSMPDCENPQVLAESIVGQFESLPTPLAITCPISPELSELFSQIPGPIQLLEKVVIFPTTKLLNEYSYTYGDAKAVGEVQLSLLLMSNDTDSKWDSKRSYVQVLFDGFADISGTSESIAEAMSVMRSFFGLLAAVNVIEHVGFPPLSAPKFLRLPVHAKYTNWQLVSSPFCDREFSDVIEGLRPTKWFKNVIEKEGLEPLLQFFNFIGQCLRESEFHGRLQLAGRWFFDSLVPSDLVSRIVRTAICLEVLYGKSSPEAEGGITELISSRLAYSISETAEERSKIALDAREFYKLRSKIVHNGHVRLRGGEYTSFSRVQDYVKRAIYHEAKLLWSSIPALTHHSIVEDALSTMPAGASHATK